jgi:N-acetylneuraminic acid mutarotase
MHTVPLELRLYANSGGVSLHHLTYLIFGGIEDDSLSFISSETYLYNHLTREVKKLANMSTPRYSFSYQRIGNRVYAIGGGNSDVDGNLDILDDCEYYSIEADSWKSICNLPLPLISSMSLCYNGHLHVFGGVGINKARNKAIFKYNHAEDSWSELSYHLPFGIEAAFIYPFKAS